VLTSRVATAGGLVFWPLIMVYLVLLGRWPQTPSGQATILVPLGVWLVLRLALWWHMKLLLGALELPELRDALSGAGGMDGDALCGDGAPQELAPLIRGAWLVGRRLRRAAWSQSSPARCLGWPCAALRRSTPSSPHPPTTQGQLPWPARALSAPPPRPAPQLKRDIESPEPPGGALPLLRRCLPALFSGSSKRRFFQLSADLTTLRWAWNKYALLFYVEAVHSCEQELSLRLVLTMEADLVLGFTVRRSAAAGPAATPGPACCHAWPHSGPLWPAAPASSDQ
jgi:hypothetical protein